MRFSIVAVLLITGCVSFEDFDDPGDRTVSAAAAITVCGTSLQSAINAAPQDSVLDICAGTYRERLVIDGKRIELRGASAGTTIVDAGGTGRALLVRNVGGAGVKVRNLTLRNGATSSTGGGISCTASALELRDAVLATSDAAFGGGLGADGCVLDIARTRFDGNDADADRGGGAYTTSSTGVIADSTFVGNDADEGGGLAMIGGDIEIRNNRFEGNSAHRGGALFISNDGWVHGNDIIGNQGRWTAGGIYVDNCAPTIEGNLIDGNTSVNDGGGLYSDKGAPVIIDNVVTDNYSGDDGGGLRLLESAAQIERNMVEGNAAADSGGGIRVSHVPAMLIDNVIRDNEAPLGGGLDLDNDSSVLRGGVISGNRATNGGGLSAALYPFSGGVIEDVQIFDNIATGKGGGMYIVDNFHPMALRHLVVRGNRAAEGGGLYVSGAATTIANSAFDRNVATGSGGGIAIRASSTTFTTDLDWLVAHGNTAASGSALYTTASNVTVDNSIFSGGSGTAIRVSVVPRWRYNDTYPRSFSGMTDPTGSSGNIGADPRFVSASTGDFRLGSGSPAINAGNPADQDVDGSRADMGMFGGPDGTSAPPPPPPPPASGAVLEADAHVALDSPGTNFGGATTLASDTSPMTQAYLRFRVTGFGPVSRAILRVSVTNATADAPAVHATSTSWDEGAITWNNRPAPGALVADLGAVAIGTVEYDVTSHVTGDGVYAFALAPETSDGFAAHSREGATPPQLILTAGAPPPPPPPSTGAVLEADAHVALATPTTNFGGVSTLSSDTSPMTEAYLRFRVTDTGTVSRAILRLAITNATADAPAVYAAASTWDEGTITWNTRPARGALVADAGPSGEFTIDYDVTSLVTGDGVFTFALIPETTDGFTAHSGEGATPPQLILTEGEPPPPTATAVLEGDTYGAADAPTTTFGGAAILSADRSPLEEAFLQFRVTGATTITRARLRLRVVDGTSDGPEIFAAASTFDEATMTWNTRPAVTGTPLCDLGAVALDATVECDVTSLVTGDGTFAFALIPTSSSGFGVSSREGGTPAVLILE